MILAKATENKQYDQVIAWGMIAILLSLVMELLIKEIARISMPFKYKDRYRITKFIKKIRKGSYA
jgi:ABC-type nitrate/sulfonate/bicarbonate transport system permease component